MSKLLLIDRNYMKEMFQKYETMNMPAAVYDECGTVALSFFKTVLGRTLQLQQRGS